MGVRLAIWIFDLQAGETEKDGFGTDAQKYIDEVKEALGWTNWSKILSFYAPFFCEDSDEEVEVLLTCGEDVDIRTKQLGSNISCDECDGKLSRDFDVDEYLRFFDNSL